MPVSADPELAARLAKAQLDLYASAAADLLALVARRLARGLDQPGWAERRLLELARLRDEAAAVLERVSAESARNIETAVTEARRAGTAQGARDLRQAGLPAGVSTGRPGQHAVEALIRETVVATQATHAAALRQTVDAYRRVISEAAGLPVTGARTRRGAAQAALDRFAMAGISGFVDRRGRHWTLESYAEMALRTAVGRAQVQGALDRIAQAGQDLVIVSDAPGECDICRPWEGRVLSISGQHPRYPSIGDARAAGLWHANCRHTTGAWVPGLSREMGDTADPAGDEARQELRRLERGVRQWKQREAVALSDGARTEARRHVREWQARIRSHVDETGLIRQRGREQLGAR